MKAKEFEKDAKNIIAEDKRKYVTEMIGGIAKVKDIRKFGLIEATIRYERD